MRYKKPHIFFIFFALILSTAYSQSIPKKAIKFYDKGDEAARERDFPTAKDLFSRSISIAPNYAKPYLKLAGIYNLYQQKDSAVMTYNRMIDAIPDVALNPTLWDRIARMNHEVGFYEDAQRAIEKIRDPDPLLKASIMFSIKSVRSAPDIDMSPLPKEINQYRLQYLPVLTVDEQTIIYTRRKNYDAMSDEDLVISTTINGEWIPSQSISPVINSPFNEGASTISADGRTLIFTSCDGRSSFGSCDLYISYRQGNKWSEPENLGSTINSLYWDSQPALSADGRTLYFASNRPGGRGKRDLWVSRFRNDQWGVAENLGPTINSKEDDTTPFIHVNGETLFFSSKGQPGLGGFDLFVSEKSGTDWTSPRNLGYPINTHHDEISLFLNAKGTFGYYAIEKRNQGVIASSEIVKFPIPTDTLVYRKASYITGRVMDSKSKKPLGANFRMTNLNDSTDTYRVTSDSISGRYFLVLTQGKEYGVFINRKGYLFEDLTFKTKENTLIQPDTLNIYLNPIEAGGSLVLENIYFEFDDYRLNPKSSTELNEIANFILENDQFKFRIEGHTDNVGSDEYNLDLSRKRAKTVYDYLLTHGVSSKRMEFRGYGSKQPIASNESEEGREMNRRIAFVVISRSD